MGWVLFLFHISGHRWLHERKTWQRGHLPYALCSGDGDLCAVLVASIKTYNCVCFVYLSPQRNVQIEFGTFQEWLWRLILQAFCLEKGTVLLKRHLLHFCIINLIMSWVKDKEIHEIRYRPQPVLISTEQRYALKGMTSLQYFCKTSCTLLTCQVQSIGNHGIGGGHLLKSVTYN
jgi:hypothetical protein